MEKIKTILEKAKEAKDERRKNKLKEENKAAARMSAILEGEAKTKAELEAKEKLAELDESNRAQKIRAIRDEFGLTDTDMKKISWKNPLLLSQSEFNLYLDDLKQRAFKLADNKFEKARMDLDKMNKEQLKTSVKQKNEETAGDIKEKRAAMKTIKDLNKDQKKGMVSPS